MSGSRRQTPTSVHGRRIDAVAAVLARILRREGAGHGAAAALIVTRHLDGPHDGAPMRLECGVRISARSRSKIVELAGADLRVIQSAVESHLEASLDKWSDLAIIITLVGGSVAITAQPSPTRRLLDPKTAADRHRYLSVGTRERMENILAIAIPG